MYLIAKSNTQSSIAAIAIALVITCISHANENWKTGVEDISDMGTVTRGKR